MTPDPASERGPPRPVLHLAASARRESDGRHGLLSSDLGRPLSRRFSRSWHRPHSQFAWMKTMCSPVRRFAKYIARTGQSGSFQDQCSMALP
ncbi:hypothetical protein AAFF_G00202980 [Aldrovandia affinis]|uniref:Uncharacterized protein n=1 Tax=Aldrovandia affinis TaxID=143900 RepID=A0AAD7SY56_9TELE|nr:hypothetical protein AAFF_G00202980 [Aldrovandia affinis]